MHGHLVFLVLKKDFYVDFNKVKDKTEKNAYSLSCIFLSNKIRLNNLSGLDKQSTYFQIKFDHNTHHLQNLIEAYFI